MPSIRPDIRYPAITGYPVSGFWIGRISGIRLLDQPDLRPAGYPAKTVSGASLVHRSSTTIGSRPQFVYDFHLCLKNTKQTANNAQSMNQVKKYKVHSSSKTICSLQQLVA
jgi:hypothetical protein